MAFYHFQVVDEMEPLRKAIKEIYDFDGKNFFYKSVSSDEDSDDYLAPMQVKIFCRCFCGR